MYFQIITAKFPRILLLSQLPTLSTSFSSIIIVTCGKGTLILAYSSLPFLNTLHTLASFLKYIMLRRMRRGMFYIFSELLSLLI